MRPTTFLTLFASGLHVLAQNAATPPVLNNALADRIIAAVEAQAANISVPQNIALADTAGHLLAFKRMDGAALVSIDVALRKARTVSLLGGRFGTGDLAPLVTEGGMFQGLDRTNGGLVVIGGGLPIKVGGTFVGGLGVSGGAAAQDVQCAEAGVAAVA